MSTYLTDETLAAVREHIPDFDLLSFDFYDPASLKRVGAFSSNGQAEAFRGLRESLERLKAPQRLMRVVNDREIADKLIARNLGSARQIATLAEHQFVRDHANVFDGSQERARKAYRRAVHISTAMTQLFANIKESVADPHFRAARFGNPNGNVASYFSRIPSYQSLFGSLDYLRTDPDQTIFSPAAYLFDIMRIVDAYITDPNVKPVRTIPPGYTLEERRPDLFNLLLTPENTTMVIPFLQLVQEVLDAIIEARQPGETAFERLAGAWYPFNLPFQYQLARIRTALLGAGTTLAKSYALLVPPSPLPNDVQPIDVARESIGLSVESLDLVTLARADVSSLSRSYGYDDITKELPVAGTGTIAFDKDLKLVTGTGTSFLAQVATGRTIVAGGYVRRVVTVSSDTALEVDAGFPSTRSGLNFEIEPPETIARLRVFELRTGLDREGVSALFDQGLSDAELARGVSQTFFINDTGEGLPYLRVYSDDSSVDDADSRIAGLSLERLDRISRFVRLMRSIGWSAADLDWSLKTIGARSIDSPTILALAQIDALAVRSGLPIDRLSTYWHDAKTIGRGNDRAPDDFFDRVFNDPALLGGADPYRSTTIPFDPYRLPPQMWTIGGTGDATAMITARLQAALQLNGDDLSRLGRYVLALVPPAAPDEFALTLPLLSWIYRLASTAQATELGIDPFLNLLGLLYYPQRPYLQPPAGAIPATIDGFAYVTDAARFLAETSLTAYRLTYALTGRVEGDLEMGYSLDDLREAIGTMSTLGQTARLTPAAFTFDGITRDRAQAIFQKLADDGIVTSDGLFRKTAPAYADAAVLFPLAPDAFVADIPPITPAQSLAVIDALEKHVPAYLDAAGIDATLAPAYRPGIDLQFLAGIFPTESGQIDTVAQLLDQVYGRVDNARKLLDQSLEKQQSIVCSSLAGLVGYASSMVRALLPHAATAAELADYLVAFLSPASVPLPQAITQTTSRISRWSTLFADLKFSAAEIEAAFVLHAQFGIANLADMVFADVQSLAGFKRLARSFGGQSTRLIEYFALPHVLSEKVAKLAELSGWRAVEIERLIVLFWPGDDRQPVPGDYGTVSGLLRLRACFDHAATIGTRVDFLLQLATTSHLAVVKNDGAILPENWSAYTTVADATDAASAAALGSTGAPVALSEARDTLESDKRDAALGYVIWLVNGVNPTIVTPNDLFQYLLLNVEMGPGQTTSRIAQAIASVQLYMQRCRMMLEPGVNVINVPAVWWSWMSQYRVWEVNRKIFLYPENYIDPTLRRGATPQFDELAEALLQRDVTKDSVQGPFIQYIDDVAALAALRNTTSFRSDRVDSVTGDVRDTVIMIGRTSTQPYSFQYRMLMDEVEWSPWKPIGVSIAAPLVAPVVAFDQFFVFWAEPDVGKGGTIKDQNSGSQTVQRARLMYSFANTRGEFSQPQVLSSEQTINIFPNVYKSLQNGQIEALLDETDAPWTVPYALTTGPGMVGTGTVTIAKGQTAVDGSNTLFKREFDIGDRIWCNAEFRLVVAVDSDIRLTVADPWTASLADTEFKVFPRMTAREYSPQVGQGTVTIERDLQLVMGKGTKFLTDLQPADQIIINDETRSVGAIQSDELLVVTSPWAQAQTDGGYLFLREKDALRFAPFVGSGTVLITKGLQIVSGSGTRFLAEFEAGDKIEVNGETKIVNQIIDDAQIIVDTPWTLSATGASYTVIPMPRNSERLLVAFGSALGTDYALPFDEWKDEPNPERDSFITIRNEFNGNMFQVLRYATDAGPTRDNIPGVVTVSPTLVLDHNFAQVATTLLVTDFNLSAAANPQPYAPLLDRKEARLSIAATRSALTANYWGNAYAGDTLQGRVPATGSSTNLLYYISGSQSAIVNVGNQPGWFVFNNGDEAFLVAARQRGLSRLSDMVMVRSRPQLPNRLTNLRVDTGAFTAYPLSLDTTRFQFTRVTTSVMEPLRQRLNVGGIDNLLTIDSQVLPELPFSRFYLAGPQPAPPYAVIPPKTDLMDFNGAFGQYFWEIFFHAPFLVAWRMCANRRYEDAKTWLEYIFNPTQTPGPGDPPDSPDRYWRFLPFRTVTRQTLEQSLRDPAQIRRSNAQPFDPDVIARYRPVAYAKTTVMKYISNLIEWADMLFGQDTRETINQASGLYVLAYDLLGPRPEAVGELKPQAPKSYRDILAQYGDDPADIPQYLIDLENTFASPWHESENVTYLEAKPYNDIRAYFTVPENSDFLAYWDVIDDRLYKIRHGLNIAGIARPLSLFAPPLDVRAIIRASAAGSLSLAAQVQPPIPFYRCDVLINKAVGFTQALAGLGSALLSALEKQDGESLALLRTNQEQHILEMTTLLKEKLIAQLEQSGTALAAALAAAQYRLAYYTQRLAEPNNNQNENEKTGIDKMETARVQNIVAGSFKVAASLGFAIPQFGSPFAMTYGGQQVGSVLNATAGIPEAIGSANVASSQISLTQAGFERRSQDWKLQKQLAADDVDQITAQIAANTDQLDAAKRDLQINTESIAQNAAMADFLHTKFTNRELYSWMANRTATIYFQSYTLAYNMARAAQQAFQYELDTDQSFIDFAYWDDLRKGLGAADGLLLALDQLDAARLDYGSRPLEIVKTISLAQLDPRALLTLQRTGVCEFAFGERLFDDDFPGHYARKVKTISVSIPAVVGPYQNIKATLTQLSNRTIVKVTPDAAGVNAVNYLLGGKDAKTPPASVLRSNWWTFQQIALSSGLNDNGMFELSFQDPRYLPFEGTGAVSTWRLNMPLGTNRFDFSSISDVIITLRYTARDGGEPFRKKVTALAPLRTYEGNAYWNMPQQYPDAWYALFSLPPVDDEQKLTFGVRNFVPPNIDPRRAKVSGVYVRLAAAAQASGSYLSLALTDKLTLPFDLTGDSNECFYDIAAHGQTPPSVPDVIGERTVVFDLLATPGDLKNDGGTLSRERLQAIDLILFYTAPIDL